MYVGEVGCRAQSIPPPPRSAAFPQAGEEKVREGNWMGKDAAVPDIRADIPVPECCQHASPGHEVGSTYPAKTDSRVKDHVH